MTKPPPALVAPRGLPAARRTELPLPLPAAAADGMRIFAGARAGVNDARRRAGGGGLSVAGAFALLCRVVVNWWWQRRTARRGRGWEWDSNRRMS